MLLSFKAQFGRLLFIAAGAVARRGPWLVVQPEGSTRGHMMCWTTCSASGEAARPESPYAAWVLRRHALRSASTADLYRGQLEIGVSSGQCYGCDNVGSAGACEGDALCRLVGL